MKNIMYKEHKECEEYNKECRGCLKTNCCVFAGVHGSNRLAGNSLLECVVFGRIAGRSAAAVDYSGDKSIYHQDRTEF